MKKDDVSRRDFGKLTLAAFGGVLAGSMLGGKRLFADEKGGAQEKHGCCGLNSCKGNGAGGDNECAGMGKCATAEAHGCAGSNDCKNQGSEGVNDCKGKGSCAVPIKGDAWTKARSNFEAAMNKAGKKFGAAPDSCGK
ncbi:MAG TPA: hypothetical protein VIC28_00430 [Thermoanaerobaculia bacterium]|jgi:hypothetical protein